MNSKIMYFKTCQKKLSNILLPNTNKMKNNSIIKIVAAKNGYTTRIPFIASKEIKEKAKSVFF